MKRGEKIDLKCANCGGGHRASDHKCKKYTEKHAGADKGQVIPLMSVEVKSNDDYPPLQQKPLRPSTPEPIWVKETPRIIEWVKTAHSKQNSQSGLFRQLLTALEFTERAYPETRALITHLVEKLNLTGAYDTIMKAFRASEENKNGPK